MRSFTLSDKKSLNIAFLGCGTWGYCLANVLAWNGHKVKIWSIATDVIEDLKKNLAHPLLPEAKPHKNMSFFFNIEEALEGVDLICESVTSNGIRPVFEQLKALNLKNIPICVTSKGIERQTGMLLPEIVRDVMGPEAKIACLSGPSHAEEVIKRLPSSVVVASEDEETRYLFWEAFSNIEFRVYPSQDINGVAFGGAMKNIIAIACGLGDGLGFGINFKAALMTRGLHEMRRLASVKGCDPQTLNGLAGMGDLSVTCLSPLSRNYSFGHLLAKGCTFEEAKMQIGAVVEGSYCVTSAKELAQKHGISLPITECVYQILYEAKPAKDAFQDLRERVPKEEHL